MEKAWISQFACLFVLLGMSYSIDDDDSTISIATLVPSDPRRLFSRERVAPAMSIAVEKVKDMQLLPNKNLSIKFADSNCNVADGINEAINYYVRKEVDVFFGPCCDYAAAPVARQIRYWNIAMVTPGAMARDFTVTKKIMFNLMTRVGPNFSSLVNFLVKILLVFDWKKVLLLYDPEGQRNIFDRYCHIAADGMHYGFKVQQEIPNLEQNYFKFDDIDDILSEFQVHVGLENAAVIKNGSHEEEEEKDDEEDRGKGTIRGGGERMKEERRRRKRRRERRIGEKEEGIGRGRGGRRKGKGGGEEKKRRMI